MVGDLGELALGRLCVGLGEDRSGIGGDEDRAALRDVGEDVAEEMDPAALPGRPDERRFDRLAEPDVGVADDEPDAGEVAGDKGAQKRPPEGAGLPVPDLEP